MWQKQDCSAPMVWKFTTEQLQDPDKVGEYLKEKCCRSSRDVQSYAMCWALATIYQTVLHTRQYSQGEEEEGRATGTVGTSAAAEPEEHAGSTCPYMEEDIQGKIHLLSEG